MKKKSLSFFAALLLSLSVSFGQKIRVAPVVGGSASIGISSSAFKQSMREIVEEAEEDNPDVSIKNKAGVVPGFVAGGLIDFRLSQSIYLQSGALFHLRGRNQIITGEGVGASGNTEKVKATIGHRVSYLELPIWINYQIGESGFKLIGGPTLGFAVKASLRSKESYSSNSGDNSDETEKLPISSDPASGLVMPFDLGFNVGVGKAFLLGRNPLELTLFAQPSLTKWSTESKVQPEFWHRHLSAGIRAAYYINIR